MAGAWHQTCLDVLCREQGLYRSVAVPCAFCNGAWHRRRGMAFAAAFTRRSV